MKFKLEVWIVRFWLWLRKRKYTFYKSTSHGYVYWTYVDRNHFFALELDHANMEPWEAGGPLIFYDAISGPRLDPIPEIEELFGQWFKEVELQRWN